MKKIYKVFLIIGAILLIAGIVLTIVGASLGEFNVDFTDEIFTSSETVEKVEVSAAAGTVNVRFEESNSVRITYLSHPQFGFTVSEKNGKVTLKPARSNWFSWGWNWNKHQNPTATVYIPSNLGIDLDLSVGAGKATVLAGELSRIKVDVAAGSCELKYLTCDKLDVDVAAGTCTLEKFTCNNLKVDVAAGSCIAKDLTCDIIDADVAAGTLDFAVLGNPYEYTVKVDKAAGSCNLTSRQGTDERKRIDVDVAAGKARFAFS